LRRELRVNRPWLFAAVLCMAEFLSAQQPPLFVPPNDASLTITPKRKVCKIGEKIEFSYRIRNTSNAEIFVPRTVWEVKCGNPPHVSVWLEDSVGKHIGPGGWATSCIGPGPVDKMSAAQRMEKDAVLLKPMAYIDGTFDFDTNIFMDQGLKPGRYRLEVGLSGWEDDAFDEAQTLSLETMKHPFLRGELTASHSIELTR
jgi:hypothetical protein